MSLFNFFKKKITLSNNVDMEPIWLGYTQIVKPIKLPENIFNLLGDRYISGYLTETPRDQERFFIEQLENIEFSWFWFEEFKDFFAQIGAKPNLWSLYKPETKEGLCKLLYSTIRFSSAAIRDMYTFKMAINSQLPDWEYGDPIKKSDYKRISLRLPTDEPPEVQEVINTFATKFNNGAGNWPPFFPGCRTSIKIMFMFDNDD
ncbi:MAG: hypothetical protein AB7U85_04840 [Alphaproteobacteria bacterium]